MKAPSLFLLYLISFSFFMSCKDEGYQTKEITSDSFQKTPEKLAAIYCSACHQLPKPEKLPKHIWEETILPRMGYLYGFYENEAEYVALFEEGPGGEKVKQTNLFPKQPTLDSITWKTIQNYYIKNAPDSILQNEPLIIHPKTDLFKTLIPNQKVNIPSTTLVNFTADGTLYLGDAFTQSFSEFSANLELLSTGNVPEGAVWVEEKETSLWLTVMGSFSPTDAAKGMIAEINKDGSGLSIPIRDLQRPVHASLGNLDNDKENEIVVCEFGKWTGALSLFDQDEQGNYQKTILYEIPGAIKAYLEDMNDDGLLDIVALFAQANEGIDIFYNQGNLSFKKERVLQFSPSMGGSFFKLEDYNGDGKKDILFTSGDNADYYPILKPWHGIYLFVNQGDNTFKESFFQHLNGAYNAIYEDFDQDGDRDIAAISFFPDWANNPKESFVFFENVKGVFKPSTFEEVNWGRWIVMDAADYDQDGDLDLVLGSLAFEALPKLGYEKIWKEKGIPFVVLQNQIQ